MIKKNIPNLFTLCNLFCGCTAIVFAFEGNLIWSAYLVGIACVFDFLDGLVARALNVHSEIGKQLDSLADMVSFGVVPGVIVFHFLKETVRLENIHGCVGCEIPPEITAPSTLEEISPYIGFLIPIFSAIRLAKFNIDSRQSDSFIGLPTPANSILIASLGLLCFWHAGMEGSKYPTPFSVLVLNYNFLIPLITISSFLLIAPLPLFALKFKNFSWADNRVRYIFLALALMLLIIFQLAGIPLIIVLYIVLSIINNFVSKKKLK